jgi:hypothetical protein
MGVMLVPKHREHREGTRVDGNDERLPVRYLESGAVVSGGKPNHAFFSYAEAADDPLVDCRLTQIAQRIGPDSRLWTGGSPPQNEVPP